MSATVIPFTCVLASRQGKHYSDDDLVARHVANRLVGVCEERVRLAQQRALRSVHSAVQMEEAIRRAVAWARCAIDAFPNPTRRAWPERNPQ